MSTESNLRFRIFEASSQDPEHPAQDLVTLGNTKSATGWQSSRFCTFPQEITLQFPQPVHLKQMKFLMHEKKIPTKIELLVCMPA